MTPRRKVKSPSNARRKNNKKEDDLNSSSTASSSPMIEVSSPNGDTNDDTSAPNVVVRSSSSSSSSSVSSMEGDKEKQSQENTNNKKKGDKKKRKLLDSTKDDDGKDNELKELKRKIRKLEKKMKNKKSTKAKTDNDNDSDDDDESHNTTSLTCMPVGTIVKPAVPMSDKDKMKRMTASCKTILECMGEDPDREGLLKTPERWAKALLFLTQGYQTCTRVVTNNAVFIEDSHKEMVVIKDIDLHSLCEHHMLPFTGRVHVGYIPNGKILGLSKVARLAEVFSRRLQVQERLTSQIADAIVEAVKPLGVAVVMECAHFCMIMRGVQKCAAKTSTSAVRGCFKDNPKTRMEFFNIIHRGNVMF